MWRKTVDTQGDHGLVQPHISSEEVCRKTCLATPKCEAVDWIQKDMKCHLHREETFFSISTYPGSVYWELKKVGECHGMISEKANDDNWYSVTVNWYHSR